MAILKVVVVTKKESLQLTVPGSEGKDCVYVSLVNGKLVFTGGASIIERIEGEGMREKVS